MISIGAAMPIGFGTGRQTPPDNTSGGAGTTITQSAAPTKLSTPSAAPAVTAQPFAGGEGWRWALVLHGALMAVTVACGFSLPALVSLRRFVGSATGLSLRSPRASRAP